MGCKISRRDGGNDGVQVGGREGTMACKISRRDGGNDGVQDK